MNKAFFIDKDGTLVSNGMYPRPPLDDLLEEDIIEGLKHIQKRGYKIIIVSNQPWIAKGHLNKEEVESVFERIIQRLNLKGIKVDDYFYCPHQTSDNCDCKKPKPKMIFEAAKKYDIDLLESFTVGDMDIDVLTGKNAGTKTILVLTGLGEKFKNIVQPTYILKNINEIKKII